MTFLPMLLLREWNFLYHFILLFHIQTINFIYTNRIRKRKLTFYF